MHSFITTKASRDTDSLPSLTDMRAKQQQIGAVNTSMRYECEMSFVPSTLLPSKSKKGKNKKQKKNALQRVRARVPLGLQGSGQNKKKQPTTWMHGKADCLDQLLEPPE